MLCHDLYHRHADSVTHRRRNAGNSTTATSYGTIRCSPLVRPTFHRNCSKDRENGATRRTNSQHLAMDRIILHGAIRDHAAAWHHVGSRRNRMADAGKFHNVFHNLPPATSRLCLPRISQRSTTISARKGAIHRFLDHGGAGDDRMDDSADRIHPCHRCPNQVLRLHRRIPGGHRAGVLALAVRHWGSATQRSHSA